MKAKILLLSLSVFMLFSACRKTYLNNSSDETLSVNLKECLQKTYGSDNISLCLDEVLNDSRCPINAVCIWQGVATAKFNMTINDKFYSFVLATSKIANTDTTITIQGYKITLLNLLPYPGGTSTEKPSAEVRITK